jgi:hypothetical protein
MSNLSDHTPRNAQTPKPSQKEIEILKRSIKNKENKLATKQLHTRNTQDENK